MVLARIVLGLLSIAPMTGYDLKRHFDSTVRHFWAADKAQIYRTLAGLVAEGFAEIVTVPGSVAPDRQEHHITAAGREALAAWLVLEPERQVERDPFLARLFFAGTLDNEDVRALLAARRETTEAQLMIFEELRADLSVTDRAARLRLATLDNGIAHARAELGWLDAIEAELT